VNPLITRAIELFDLVGYVIDHGGEEAQANQWALVCPTCGKKKLVVDLGRRAWHCWVCEQYGAADVRTGKRQVLQGAGGLIDLVQFLEGWDRKRAAEFVLADQSPAPKSGAYRRGSPGQRGEGARWAENIATTFLPRMHEKD